MDRDSPLPAPCSLLYARIARARAFAPDRQPPGNTAVVVEHHEAFMRGSDHLIEMGPGAGHLGGRVVSHGTPDAVAKLETSITGAFLSGREEIPVPSKRRSPTKDRAFQL